VSLGARVGVVSAPLVLVAASGLAREVAEAARRAGREVLGAVDDDPAKWGTTLHGGLQVLGGLDTLDEYQGAGIVLCPGRGPARAALAARLRERGAERFATVVDPSCVVPSSCVVGAGSVLLAGTVLTASVRVGRHVVCMPHVTLTHDDVVGDHVTLAAGVRLGGGVHVGDGAYLGMGASVRENLRVGADSVLGMGSVLLEDLPEGATWAGVPARRLP
jgi:sugar O-acyltransferase (sialic acid O-acetyltransferase NeuD family)